MQNTAVRLASPAQARDCSVEEPISRSDRLRNTSPNPSMCLSSRGRTASGVESRPEKPVPPVTSATCTCSLAIHCDSSARMRYTSSAISALSASLWPASTTASARKSPEVSLSRVRVSETVNTAMFRATAGSPGSVFGGLSSSVFVETWAGSVFGELSPSVFAEASAISVFGELSRAALPLAECGCVEFAECGAVSTAIRFTLVQAQRDAAGGAWGSAFGEFSSSVFGGFSRAALPLSSSKTAPRGSTAAPPHAQNRARIPV